MSVHRRRCRLFAAAAVINHPNIATEPRHAAAAADAAEQMAFYRRRPVLNSADDDDDDDDPGRPAGRPAQDLVTRSANITVVPRTGRVSTWTSGPVAGRSVTTRARHRIIPAHCVANTRLFLRNQPAINDSNLTALRTAI